MCCIGVQVVVCVSMSMIVRCVSRIAKLYEHIFFSETILSVLIYGWK